MKLELFFMFFLMGSNLAYADYSKAKRDLESLKSATIKEGYIIPIRRGGSKIYRLPKEARLILESNEIASVILLDIDKWSREFVDVYSMNVKNVLSEIIENREKGTILVYYRK